MPSDDITVLNAQQVIDALAIVADAGQAGLEAASERNPDFTRFLIRRVRALLFVQRSSPEEAAVDGLASSAVVSESPNESKLSQVLRADNASQAAAKAKRTSKTKELAGDFGSKAVTNMTRFVILQHLANHPRETTVQTILDELMGAELLDEKQRTSLVTSLHRLKTVNKYITWPEGARGEQITLTPQGREHLGELISR